MNTFSLYLLIFLSFLTLFTLFLTLLTIRRLNKVVRFFEPKNYYGPPVGEAAPDFVAKTWDGTPVTLDTYNRRSVVFLFLSISCPACESQLSIIQSLKLGATLLDVDFVMVYSEDEYDEVTALLNKSSLDIPIILSDKTHLSINKQYNRSSIYPFFCLIDEQSKIVDCGAVGGEGWSALRKVWERASIMAENRVTAFDHNHVV
jgi:peroxiredoxin